METPSTKASISGLVLAGGRSSRMGRDKALIQIGDRTMLEHSIEQLQQQCDELWVSCAADDNYPIAAGVRRVADNRSGFLGPLAGIEAALRHIQGDYLLTAPCDCMDIPANLAEALLSETQKQGCPIAYASNRDGDQYLCALIHREVLADLSHYLDQGERRVGAFYRQQGACMVSQTQWQPCFFNINTPDQLREYLTHAG